MAIVRANGIEIAWQGCGNPRDPCLLLIMGFNMPLNAWPEPFCRQLAAGGFYVVRFDNRDVGGSSRLDHLGQPAIVPIVLQRFLGRIPKTPYTLEDMGADAGALLDALDIRRAHVVGISMGGMIAQCMALANPQRVLSLGLMMTSTSSRRFLLPSPALLPLLWRQPGPDAESQLRYALVFWRRVAGPRYPPDETLLRAQLQQAARLSRGPHGRRRQLAALLAAPDRRHTLRRLGMPTTVIHGTADPLIPVAAGRALAEAIDGARLELISGLGHYLPESLWPRFSASLLANCPPSMNRYRDIYRAIARIPAGTVSSYGAVAAAAGLPGRARLVGKALRETPAGLDLPWFRVVRADGSIAFPAGSRQFEQQCARLLDEGVRVIGGRVDRSAFDLPKDLDRLLWGPEDQPT